MNAGTILTFAGSLAAVALLAVLVRASARSIIHRLEMRLRTRIDKQNKTLDRQRTTIAEQRKLIANHRDILNRQRTTLSFVTDKLSRLEGRMALADAIRPLPSRPKHAHRSVLFLHDGGYHFSHLAAALRRRGWDAVVVSNTPIEYQGHDPYDGECSNIFSNDPCEFRARLRGLIDMVPDRFRMVHFGGNGDRSMSFFRDSVGSQTSPKREGTCDLQELKERGVKIGYTIMGCRDGIKQSVYKKHKDVCAKCVWELRPSICSDSGNTSWGEFIAGLCDLVAVEADYGHEGRTSPHAYREPLTTAIDKDYWHPNLAIPQPMRLSSGDRDLIVLHDSSDTAMHRLEGRDVKGSVAIVAAVARLKSEGVGIRLVQPSGIMGPNWRFLVAQADIIVEQLSLGRYGRLAREGLMLGRPVICHIDRSEPPGVPELTCLSECPLVDATDATIYQVLKRLLSSQDERERIGHANRTYALKWHGSDSAAERYERVYDRVMAGLPLNVSESEIHGD